LYIPQNPKAPEDVRSYSWNAFACENISFASIATDYLDAKKQVERNRNEDSRNFHLQVLSNWYHIGLNDNQIELSVGEEVGQDGPDGLRFLCCDVQKEVLYYVVVAYFKEKKEIHLIDYDKIPKDFETLQKVQVDNRVSFKNVLIDSGDQTQEVYRACASHFKVFTDPKTNKKRRQCWLSTKGDEPRDGVYYHAFDKKWRMYSPISKQEVVMANKIEKSFCKLTRFATSPCRTLLQELIDNKHPQWKLFFSPEAAADQTFKAHLQVDKPVKEFSKRNNQSVTRWVNPQKEDNHYADAMNLATLSGVLAGYI
jgi:hypothetical protein